MYGLGLRFVVGLGCIVVGLRNSEVLVFWVCDLGLVWYSKVPISDLLVPGISVLGF